MNKMTFKQAMMRYLKSTSQLQILKNKNIGPIVINNFVMGAWRRVIRFDNDVFDMGLWRELQPQKDFHVGFPKTSSELIHLSQVFDNEGIFWNSNVPFSSLRPWTREDVTPKRFIVTTNGLALYSSRPENEYEEEGYNLLTLSEFVEKWHALRDEHDAIATKIIKNGNQFKNNI